MNINNLPIFTFACFSKPINEIEKFLNFRFRDRIDKKTATIIRVQKNVDIVFNEFEELRKFKAARIESNQYSYEAYFFNSLIKPEKTIMISSLEDGWYTLCNIISENLKCEYYLFTLDDESLPEPKNSFIYVNNMDNELQRVLYSMKVGKWLFYEQGEPLPFEELSHYKQRIIRKRLTKQILIDYCKKLGLFVEDKHFWEQTGEGLYIEYLF